MSGVVELQQMPGTAVAPGRDAAPAPFPGQVALTAIILACNEAGSILSAIRSVSGFSGEVIVVDSGSTDGTVELAKAAGARVLHLPWEGTHALQKNRAVEFATFDWCLHLDADEIVDRDLACAIVATMEAGPSRKDVFALTRQGEFLGVAIPTRPRPGRRLDLVRLYNRREARFDPDARVHETVLHSGKATLLPGLLYHWRAFSLSDKFAQINRYSTTEAEEKDGRGARSSVPRLVCMPIARFFWHYLFDGSWRAGRIGFLHAMTAATAEFMRESKLWELQRQAPPPPKVAFYQGPAQP